MSPGGASRAWLVGIAVGIAGCSREPAPAKVDDGEPDAPAPAPLEVGPKSRAPAVDEDAHVVVFSDRAAQAYLLLVKGEAPKAPTRAELVALVRSKLGTGGGEVDKLVELIEQEPIPPAGFGTDTTPTEHDRIRRLDLLGLAIDVLPVLGEGSAIAPELLADPVLTRTLTQPERESLGQRGHAILLRAEYRNRDAVRGLRLLQTLVRLVAEERDALVYDADTNETVDVATFDARRLRSGEGNVAEQIVIVPFPDPRRPGHARMATRGMRRFASPELELDGLPRDPQVLDRASHLLAGLAYRMVREGEYDASGYAVQLDDVITTSIGDVEHAYAGQSVRVPKCSDCPGETEIHLVERPTEPQDPPEQVVVRVVAPRSVSDAADYDHGAWAREAITDLFGPMP